MLANLGRIPVPHSKCVLVLSQYKRKPNYINQYWIIEISILWVISDLHYTWLPSLISLLKILWLKLLNCQKNLCNVPQFHLFSITLQLNLWRPLMSSKREHGNAKRGEQPNYPVVVPVEILSPKITQRWNKRATLWVFLWRNLVIAVISPQSVRGLIISFFREQDL